jgi:pimeloyl-ACP methyl ester carboxylesterase
MALIRGVAGIVTSITVVFYFIMVSIPNLLDAVQASTDTHLPILLIHGYSQDSTVWDQWVQWLREDNFSNIYPITFQNDDRCGSAEEHAEELSGIVDRIVADTGHEQVNIVGHSKGGLDARTYIATGTDRVANLVMIGTPNNGTSAALWDFTGCFPVGISELLPGSPGTTAEDRPENTNYFTIAGNWLPNVLCPTFFGIMVEDGGNCFLPGDDDGLVTVESVNSSPNYTALGEETPHYHLDLLQHREEYEMASTVLDDIA